MRVCVGEYPIVLVVRTNDQSLGLPPICVDLAITYLARTNNSGGGGGGEGRGMCEGKSETRKCTVNYLIKI